MARALRSLSCLLQPNLSISLAKLDDFILLQSLIVDIYYIHILHLRINPSNRLILKKYSGFWWFHDGLWGKALNRRRRRRWRSKLGRIVAWLSESALELGRVQARFIESRWTQVRLRRSHALSSGTHLWTLAFYILYVIMWYIWWIGCLSDG